METSRRKWLTQTGWVLAGLGIAGVERTIASPVRKTRYPLSDTPDGHVRLSFNENPYGPSPMAREAMADAVHISNRYPWEMIHEFIAAVAKRNSVTDENVLAGAGSTQIIDTVIQYAARQKGNFIVADPTFSRWSDAAEKLGLQKITVPLTTDKRNDLPAMLHAINADTRMVYLCNPNNPTGTICKYDTLVSFIKEATRRTLVLVDEAYLDYSAETSVVNLVPENENLVVVKTFSKIYGLAGSRIGYALAHKKTIDNLGELQSGANFGIGVVSLAGALASLKDADFVKQSFLQNEKARTFTIDSLEYLDMRCIPSHSNFIYFSLANYRKDFFEQLKTHNIGGTGVFEDKGKWTRITVGTMDEMKKFIGAIG